MLGLGVRLNKYQGYSEGEYFRERFLAQVGTYNASTNPIGAAKGGIDYIGNFNTDATHADFTTSNANKATHGGSALRVSATAGNGYAYIAMAVTPGVKLSITFVISAVQSTNAKLLIGTEAGDSSIYNSGNKTASTTTTTLTPSVKIIFIHFLTVTSSRWVNWDSISIKRA